MTFTSNEILWIPLAIYFASFCRTFCSLRSCRSLRHSSWRLSSRSPGTRSLREILKTPQDDPKRLRLAVCLPPLAPHLFLSCNRKHWKGKSSWLTVAHKSHDFAPQGAYPLIGVVNLSIGLHCYLNPMERTSTAARIVSWPTMPVQKPFKGNETQVETPRATSKTMQHDRKQITRSPPLSWPFQD